MLKYFIFFSTIMCSFPLAGECAHAATMDLKQLQSMLTDLGVTATIVDDRVVVPHQAKSDNEFDFTLSADKSTLNVGTSFEVIPPEKHAVAPYADMLNANTLAGLARFGLCRSNDAEWICVSTDFQAQALSKKFLRVVIDDMIAKIDTNEPLWNQAKWVAPLVSTKDAKATFDAAWDASPMHVDNAMFVSAPASRYGNFDKRNDVVFKPGEDMIAYVEPKNYQWKDDGTGGFTFGVVIDAAVLNDKGEVIYEKLKLMGPLSFATREHVDELMLNLTFSLTGASAGDYTLRYTIHDINGAKSAVVALPFKFQG